MENNRTFLEKLLDGAEVEWKPLWSITTWDKKFNAVEKEKQPKVIKYHYYLASELKPLIVDGGYVKLLTTNESDIWTTEELVQNNISEGEIIAIPWGGNPIVQYYKGKFVTADNRIATSNNTKILDNKFLYYFLLSKLDVISSFYRGSGIKHPSMYHVLEMLIPIPPLPVQTEIVKILDALTALTSELTSELTLRRKQYEYYREKLLSHDSSDYSTQKSDKVKFFHTSNIQWLHLNEIYKFQYGIGNKIPTIGGEYPVYGSNGIVGTHNEYNSENAPVIGHIGAYAGIVNWAEGKHFVTYNGIICNKINDNVNSRYAYYLLLSQNFIDKANKASQPFISYDILNKCIVPVPPLEEQQRIVSILDKFEALTHSITEGLPLAIEQSQKRYEYYRELLLSF